MDKQYIETVRLLLDIAPTIFKSGDFAMKGGTAINLFVQDMPRLSVDIDAVVIDRTLDRITALSLIRNNLAQSKSEIERLGYRVNVPTTNSGDEVKLFIDSGTVGVKVEINFIFRGTVLSVEQRNLTEKTQIFFSENIKLPILDTDELYGSKLVAAMDRQHPRDIFDVQNMLDRFGMTQRCIDCFVVYLAGHNRPVHEVLFPKIQPLKAAYENEFRGMTRDVVSLESLMDTQKKLITEMPLLLSDSHKKFLFSLVKAEPNWSLLPFDHIQALPAIQWKLLNLQKLKQKNSNKFDVQYDNLEALL